MTMVQHTRPCADDVHSEDGMMRICSLLPSVTDICISLGLADNLVAVTHECNLAAIAKHRSCQSDSDTNKVHVVTKSGFANSLTQKEIDDAVKKGNGDGSINVDMGSLSALYPILQDEFLASRPTIVLTQTLCAVCAPSPKDVTDMISACNLDPSIEVYPFQPQSLMNVVETFVTVSKVCKVPHRGIQMKHEFMQKLSQVQAICNNSHTDQQDGDNANSGLNTPKRKRSKPKVLLLEWIDPPYDGGHWIPDMIEWVGCEAVQVGNTTIKSKQVTWDDIYSVDPDVVLVACCGFDLKRNVQDAKNANEKLCKLRAAKEKRIYACNGDMNFARPGPNLLGGIAVVARCAYEHDTNVVTQLEQLEFWKEDGCSMEWERVDIFDNGTKQKKLQHNKGTMGNCEIGDIEDVLADYVSLHKEACEKEELTYIDPDTGFQVFTEVAHKKRGKCCGGGCRHCPFNHENVKDKAKRIQQPAFLVEGTETVSKEKGLVSLSEAKLEKNVHILVLFFSGGKDSFLAIRATLRSYISSQGKQCNKICLILLTTFDAQSRIIAHQEIDINDVIHQASHLNLPLLGVPMHRASSETYLERISSALDYTATCLGLKGKNDIHKLIFGDLHLDHIRQWRDKELGKLGIDLEYPLWKVPYPDLMEDLLASGVDLVVSASTKDAFAKGQEFNQQLYERAIGEGHDGFGENGEFHTLVKVWSVSRERSLGIESMNL